MIRTYPIIFSDAMIKALLAGKKTQTRRLVTSMWSNVMMHHDAGDCVLLYTREAWSEDDDGYAYRADCDSGQDTRGMGWRPSIHQPRCASRLTLDLSEVRIERLQDISEEDAIAEGCRAHFDKHAVEYVRTPNGGAVPMHPMVSAGESYKHLWISLHGYKSWEENPKIVVLSFDLYHNNVDDLIVTGDMGRPI